MSRAVESWRRFGNPEDLIGALGAALGDAGLNIATFHLGRAAPGEDAIALIELDEAIPPPVLVRLRELPHIKQAESLEF